MANFLREGWQKLFWGWVTTSYMCEVAKQLLGWSTKTFWGGVAKIF